MGLRGKGGTDATDGQSIGCACAGDEFLCPCRIYVVVDPAEHPGGIDAAARRDTTQNFFAGRCSRFEHSPYYKDWGASPSQIIFRTRDETAVLGPADVLAFGVNGERYETYRVHVIPYSKNPTGLPGGGQIDHPYDSTVFLQVVVTGKLTLWELRTKLQTSYFFISGKTGKPDQLLLITRLQEQENGTTAAGAGTGSRMMSLGVLAGFRLQ